MRITIRDITIDAHIGITDEEKAKTQPLIICVDIDFNSHKATISDDINDTVDYFLITKEIRRMVEKSRFDLLETLAKTIVDHINRYPLVTRTAVTIDKPKALEPMARSVAMHYEA